ncbi:MAG: thioredoxin domain-containing protein [Planctomycetes bacterium]|nr:thioredoxin domain-containing protein [Planctomycetota bacterium]
MVLLAGGVAALRYHVACAQDDGKGGEEREHARPPLPSREEIATLPPDGGAEFNRLIFESSPYLLQHARNPVDWHPWGEAAFERAKREDKPVFLSVGYSTCHWCHVMERESFENDEVATLMNERVIAVKVDREERPDVDAIYMAAVQTMTGSGGWPMSVFLTPEGKPFWCGTYFPPEDRHGRPGFKTVLTRIGDLWMNRREELLEGAEQLTRDIQSQGSSAQTAEIGAQTLKKGFDAYRHLFDEALGGFGSAPKFPRSHSLSFLLRYHRRSGEAKALAMVETTLDRMARGGMHDHLGGGFHRYSTDRKWLVPHFEKMLYDQALLARTYLEAWQVTGKEQYAAVARDIINYVLRDMTDPGGGFYSAEDADSEGVEGKFYVWTKAELQEALGAEDGEVFSRIYGAAEGGNFREEASGEETRRNILHLPKSLSEAARELKTDAAGLEKRLSDMRARLFQIRERRVHPYRDDKILTDWNGLMIGAIACGGRVLGDDRYLEAARAAASFALGTLEKDGRLLHRCRNGQASIKAFLDDYAFLTLGLLDLYEATLEVRWLRESKRLAGEMVRLFWDEKEMGFHFSGSDGERLIARTQELYDGAIPSGNSVATLALLRIGRLTMDGTLEGAADENLKRFSGEVDRSPTGYPFMLMALDFAVGPTKEVVLAGPPDDAGIMAMRTAIDRRFLPELVVALHPTDEAAAEIEAVVPFLKGLLPIDGKGTAYVCENHACNLPTTDDEKMVQLIDRNGR